MATDSRLYLLNENCTVDFKRDDATTYCHRKNPNDDHYHRLSRGEMIFTLGDEVYCLNCGLEMGFVTRDRPQLRRRPNDFFRK